MSLARVRSSGPLGKLQREADVLKTKIDEVTGITNKWNPKTAEDPQVINCHKNCVQYKIDASSLLLRANDLIKIDEPSLVSNFEQKKQDEIKRLQSFQTRLDRLINSMEMLESGDQLRKTEKTDDEVKENPETVDEDYEEESEDEDAIVEEEEVDEPEWYVVCHDFSKQNDGDLEIKNGDVLEILAKRNDGWWKARNDDEQTGLVPSNFLEVYEDDEEDDEEEKDEDEEGQDEEEQPKKDDVVTSALPNPKQTTDQDVSDTVNTSVDQPSSTRSGQQLWKGVRKSLNETEKTDVTDVLSAMGALPAGFRPSTLYNRMMSGPQYSLRNAILPKLTESNLSFYDLHLDPVTSQIRNVVTRVLRSCQLLKCRMIPVPGTGVEVLSHHVRMCLFDGNKILSNIHTVRGQVDATKPKFWSFQTYTRNAAHTAVLSTSLTDSVSFVRTDNSHSNVGILFELCVTYIRNPPRRLLRLGDGLVCEYSDTDDDAEEGHGSLGGARQRIRHTGERGELSCGWVHLKLFDEQGSLIPNRTYDLRLNGGTPYEQGVDVDPAIQRRAPTNRLRAFLAANKQPSLLIRIGTPSVEKRKYLELLPATIVLPASYSELVAYHRRVLADALVRDRLISSDADLIHSPVISTFLSAVHQPDIMDAVLVVWNEKKRPLTRGDKRDKENMKNIYKSVVMEAAYPLLHLPSLPEARWADAQVNQTRGQLILKTIQTTRQEKGVLQHLLTSSGGMEPFDINEVTYDLLHDHWRSLA